VCGQYVGEGEKLVRSAFALARRLAPCVLFVDELDALFGARAGGRESGGALAHRGVLTEFMQEMDGLRSRAGAGVVVVGATNRPFDLDDAVLRRLPRRLLVDLPGEDEREGRSSSRVRDRASVDRSGHSDPKDPLARREDRRGCRPARDREEDGELLGLGPQA
jgi:SpoVK/Ycf46/Vps4 family AAA+-type ATPase